MVRFGLSRAIARTLSEQGASWAAPALRPSASPPFAIEASHQGAQGLLLPISVTAHLRQAVPHGNGLFDSSADRVDNPIEVPAPQQNLWGNPGFERQVYDIT